MARQRLRGTLLLLAIGAGCSTAPEPVDAGTGPLDAGEQVLCRFEGQTCLFSESCCAPLVCVDARCGPCVKDGEACGAEAPCCPGSDCVNHECRPACFTHGTTCERDEQCCGRLCAAGVCGR